LHLGQEHLLLVCCFKLSHLTWEREICFPGFPGFPKIVSGFSENNFSRKKFPSRNSGAKNIIYPSRSRKRKRENYGVYYPTLHLPFWFILHLQFTLLRRVSYVMAFFGWVKLTRLFVLKRLPLPGLLLFEKGIFFIAVSFLAFDCFEER
jgi:hypothetical protein